MDDGKKTLGKKHLLRAAGLVGLMTLTSRILGMIRDIVTADRFGTSWQMDAFIYAFMLPNFFRRLVGEGALSSAFIPVYSEVLQQKGKDAAFRFANVVITFVTALLVVFLLVVELVLAWLVRSGLFSQRFHLMFDLLQYTFPYLFFISIFALAMGILNCHQHFFTPSLGPVILDIFWIVAVIWIIPYAGRLPEDQLRWLAVILVISAIVQVAADLPPLSGLKFKFRWIWDIANEKLRQTGKLLLPAIMSFAVVQINILVDSTIGLWIGPGANSSLWYGNRLMQFPLGVFAIAMGTALLPTVSHHIARKEFEQAKKALSFALRSVFLIILPCTAGLIVLRVPIVKLLFERGEFDAVSTARSASVLMFYSVGLFAYSGQKLIASGFYAIQDTKTPVKIGIAALLVNVLFNLILMVPMRESGLALATSISGIFQFVALSRIYNKKVTNFPFKEILGSFLRITVASLLMGVAAHGLYGFLCAHFAGNSVTHQLIQVFGTILPAVILFVLLCFLLRVQEMHEAFDFLLRRKKKTAGKEDPAAAAEISELSEP